MEELKSYIKSPSVESMSKNYPKGQVLLYKNELPEDVLVLREGIIKVYDEDENGNEKILHLLKPLAIVPFAFFSGGKRPLQRYYAALTDCEVCVVPFNDFMDELGKNNKLTIEIMNWFSIELHELMTRLSSLGKTTAEDKIKAALRFLVVLNSKKTKSGWVRINFPVNHQLLADMTGVTRERAAVIMKELSDQKFISNPKQNTLDICTSKLLSS
jgi:CRP-like cAMP-binding protein